MVFSSTTFLFWFLPLVLIIYYMLRKELRNSFLLLASLFFYAWGEPSVVFVMILSIIINYGFGLLINLTNKRNSAKPIRLLVLILTVCTNLGILFYYKYTDFLIEIINGISGAAIPLKHIVLPIGISFFTFQGMSYVLDLYMGNVSVQKNPLNIALYISMFPQLIAGPIVRYVDVNNEIEHRSVTMELFSEGIWRFSIGLGKKVILANNLALVADEIFALAPEATLSGVAWVGILCYAFQIYFDFSGYSDMAIGLGKMFGFHFLENFNYPYISKSISDFWRRWHISLSTWFRDYLYIPMGGNRKGNVYLHLIIVFLCTGLWHGASWNFVVWGIWHGCFLIIERVLRVRKSKPDNNAKRPFAAAATWAYTMFIVLLGWVLFRADNLQHAFLYMGRMFGIGAAENVHYTLSWFLTPRTIACLFVAALASIPYKKVFPSLFDRVRERATLCLCGKSATALILLGISIMYVMTSTYNPFIYFRF